MAGWSEAGMDGQFELQQSSDKDFQTKVERQGGKVVRWDVCVPGIY